MKRIISILLTLSMFCGFSAAFAENEIDITGNMSASGIFTEDNVIYTAMRQMEEVSHLGGTYHEDVSAKFEVALGFDMSPQMYRFDNNGEMLWLEQFRSFTEQNPDNTKFAMLNNSAEFTADLSSEIDALKRLKYGKVYNIINIMNDALNVFDSGETNKILIASTSHISNIEVFQNKMNELKNHGIVPFVFVLNPSRNDLLNDIEYVYQCINGFELRMAISDLYLSFNEFASAALYADSNAVNTVEYKSDFKSDRHMLNSDTLSGGQALVSVLNMYGCVPLSAKASSEYNIINNSDIHNFVRAENSSLSTDTVTALSRVWDEIYNDLDGDILTPIKAENGADELKNILERNLKRYFPIIIEKDNKWYIVSSYNGADLIGTQFGEQNINEFTAECKVFDTYEYLVQTAAKVKYVQEATTIDKLSVKLSLSYPTDYDAERNVEIKQIADTDDKINGIMNTPVFGANSVNVTMVVNDAEDIAKDNWIAVSAKTTFENGIADIYNHNKIYNLKPYKDVPQGAWYSDVLFTATNAGIINGDENGLFHESNPIKRCEFVKIVLEAAKIPADETTGENIPEHWADKYMITANELGILLWGLNASADYYDEEILRYEAAYMITELMINKKDKINVPTILYKYTDDTQNMQNTQWQKLRNEFDNAEALDPLYQEKASEAFYQMYMNNVIIGNERGEIQPYEKLSRAAAAKIIVKPLFELDANLSQVLVNFEEGEKEDIVTPIELDGYGYTLDEIVFDGNGKRTFEFTIKDGDKYRYMIETLGESTDGKIELEVTSKGNGTVGEYSGTNKKHVQGADTYTITVTKEGIANVGLHIQAIAAPQEVVFDKQEVDEDGTKVFNIFDDHPEHIRECDLMDGVYGEPNQLNQGTALSKFEKLEPGRYIICSTHCVNNDGYLSSGFPSISSDIYYDLAFYNATKNNNVKITKLGYASSYVKRDAWDTCQNDSNIYMPIGAESPIWISDILYNTWGDTTLLTKGNDWGSMELEMEFEVISGTVDLITVAYHSKPTDEQFNEWDLQGKINAPYETLETVKGKGKTRPQLKANFEYYIDDSSAPENKETRLPVEITNMFYNRRNLDFFSINCSAFSYNNHMNAVGSAIVPLEYSGDGIVERDAIQGNPNGNTIEPTYSVWKFDDYHTFYIDRDDLLPNERFSDDFISSLPNRSDKEEVFLDLTEVDEGKLGKKKAIISASNPGYGLTYTYNIRIHNFGSAKTFSYLFQGGGNCKVAWSAWNGNTKYDEQISTTYWTRNPIEVANINIPENSDITIIIDIVMICGSNPITHNAFALNVPLTEFTNEDGYVYYKKSEDNALYDYNKINNYPQD